MKKLLFLTFLLPLFAIAQVGIGTTDPDASLDIRSSNQATPANTDGILIPKINEFPVTNPGVAQNGMLVYVTGLGTPARGFYYWDNNIPAWVTISSIERINDLADGKSDNDGSENGSSVFLGINSGQSDDNDDRQNVGLGFQALQNTVTGNNNVGIGYGALRLNTDVRNTAIGHTALTANTTGSNNTAIGGQSLSNNTTGDSNVSIGAFNLSNNEVGRNNVSAGNQGLRSNIFGDNNTAFGDYAGRVLDFNNTTDLDNDFNVYLGGGSGNSDRNAARNVYIGYNSGAGNYNITAGTGTLEDKSGNIFIGYEAGYNELNSDRLYIENSNAGQNGALIYGRFDIDLVRINGALQIGNPTATNGYELPAIDGTANQILLTDGNGAVTWQDYNTSMSIARATVTTNQTITTANTWTKISFNATDFDLNTDFDAVNNVFTVPSDGIYRITAMYTSDVTLNNSDTFGIRVTRNFVASGSSNLQEVNYKHMSENSRVVRQVSTIADLNSGETIEIQARVNTASGLTIDSSSRFTSFSIERVR